LNDFIFSKLYGLAKTERMVLFFLEISCNHTDSLLEN